MFKKLERVTALTLLVLAAFTLGCGSDIGTQAGGTTGPAPTPDLGNFPLGSFVCTLDASDVSESYKFLAGTHRYTFTSDGRFRFWHNSASVVAGAFTVSGNQMTITDQSGSWSCGGTVHGTYTWSFDGSDLSFSEVSDNCGGRVAGMSTKPYTKE